MVGRELATVAAIGNAHFFVANARYVFGDLNTWGWVMLCLGVLQLIVGLGVFVKNQFALCGLKIIERLIAPGLLSVLFLPRVTH